MWLFNQHKPYLIAGLLGTAIVSAVAHATGMIADYQARTKADMPFSVPRGAVRPSQTLGNDGAGFVRGADNQDYFFGHMSWARPLDPIFGSYADSAFPSHPENPPLRDFVFNSAPSFNEVTDYYGNIAPISGFAVSNTFAFADMAEGGTQHIALQGSSLKVNESRAIRDTETVSPVPEPANSMMLVTGLALIVSVKLALRQRIKH